MITRIGKVVDLINGYIAKFMFENVRPKIVDAQSQMDPDSPAYSYLEFTKQRIDEKVLERTERIQS